MNRTAAYALAVAVRLVSDGPLLWMLAFLWTAIEGAGGTRDAAFNFIVFTAFAVLHSALAASGVKRQLGRLLGADRVRLTHVLVSGVSLALVLHLWRPLHGQLWRTHGVTSWLLAAAFAATVAAMVLAASSIDYLDFIGVRRWLRRAQHKPERPPALSIAGLFAHVRHPMYAALLGALWIGPAMSYTRLEFALLSTAYVLIGTWHEERNLRHEFGEPYDIYRANVPMWVPRLTPWRPETGTPAGRSIA